MALQSFREFTLSFANKLEFLISRLQTTSLYRSSKPWRVLQFFKSTAKEDERKMAINLDFQASDNHSQDKRKIIVFMIEWSTIPWFTDENNVDYWNRPTKQNTLMVTMVLLRARGFRLPSCKFFFLLLSSIFFFCSFLHSLSLLFAILYCGESATRMNLQRNCLTTCHFFLFSLVCSFFIIIARHFLFLLHC